MNHNDLLNKLSNLESVFIGDQEEDLQEGTDEEKLSKKYT